MAGGRSERMRARADQTHKALVCLSGVPLLERNLLALYKHGFCDVVVAFNARESAIRDYLCARGKELSQANNACLRFFEETVPLGTIGAAGAVQCDSDLLVINVDNISTLDLQAFRDHHLKTGAALSIATHYHQFRVPFGEVVVRNGLVTEYREKPSLSVHLSSGTYILSRRARSMIPKDRRTNVPDLFAQLLNNGDRVVSFEHEAPWIDINDSASLEAAEHLIKAHSAEFDKLSKSHCHD